MPVTSAAERVPAPVLVLAGIVSVQFGGALAQTLVPVIGAGGSVVMRLLFATALLLVIVRPRWRGHSRTAWLTVGAFGVALGLMNFTFYGSLAYLPIGVAVTIEFIGPLTLAAALSRLKDCARGTENLLPAVLECVEAYATVGEVTAAWKEVFGEYPILAA